MVKWKINCNTFKKLNKASNYARLSATKYCAFLIKYFKEMYHLVFQDTAKLAFAYFVERLSETNNIIIFARLSDTLPQIHIYLISLRFITDIYELYLNNYLLNRLSFNITFLLSILTIPNLFNTFSPNIFLAMSYGDLKSRDFLGVELMLFIISNMFLSV